MKVRATQTGFIYNKLRIPDTKSEEFELVDVKHSVAKDDQGNPVIITVEQQFSSNWMEKLEEDKPRAKPGPKPKAKRGPKPKVNLEEGSSSPMSESDGA